MKSTSVEEAGAIALARHDDHPRGDGRGSAPAEGRAGEEHIRRKQPAPQALLKADLVDELHLLVHPIVLGGGKKLLPEGTRLDFTLPGPPVPTGVVGMHYVRKR